MLLGCRVGYEGPVWRAQALGARTVSLHLSAAIPPAPRLADLREARLDVLGVLTRGSFSDPNDWRTSFYRDMRLVADLVRSGLLQGLAIGHEPDDGLFPASNDNPLVFPRGGTGSWVMSLEDLGELLATTHEYLRTIQLRVPLWLGGISRPEILRGLDLSLLHGVLLHPYGSRPESDWPSETWGQSVLGDLLTQVRTELTAQGQADRVKVGLGEVGIADYGTEQGFAAEWISRMLSVAAADGVDRAYVCCDSDWTLDGYGQFDVSERAKPSVARIAAVGARLATTPAAPSLDEESDATEETELDPLPWPDQHFTEEMINTCLDRLAHEAGRADSRKVGTGTTSLLWPEVGPYLDTYGWTTSKAAKVALLAHLAVATDYSMMVRAEPYNYDRAERLYGHRTAAGEALGNIYPGDGYRYRGRGLLPLRGRLAYRQAGDILGVPLAEEPDLALDVTLAAGVLVVAAHERGLLAAAERGDWAMVARGFDPALNLWELFLRAAQVFTDEVDPAGVTQGHTVSTAVRDAAYERAQGRIGDTYREGGDGARGFDAVGLVAWAYHETTGVTLAASPDMLELETDPISPSEARPGDLILYSYVDLGRPDLKWPHVALVTAIEGVVLDARAGVGVGYHGHVQGAVKHYRRVRLPSAQEEADEAMWKAEVRGPAG